MLDSCSVAGSEVLEVVALKFHLCFRIDRYYLTGILLLDVVDFNILGLAGCDRDETVGLEGNGQHRIVVVVKVAADDVNPPRRPGDELGLPAVELLKLEEEIVVARIVVVGVEFVELAVGDFQEHVI